MYVISTQCKKYLIPLHLEGLLEDKSPSTNFSRTISTVESDNQEKLVTLK